MRILILISLYILSFETPVFCSDIAREASDVGMVTDHASYIENNILSSREISDFVIADLSKMKFTNKLDYLSRDGSFKTSFSIKLPLSRLPLSKLNFSYSSNNFKDEGFGHGISLSLPRILRGPLVGNVRTTVVPGLVTDGLIVSHKKINHLFPSHIIRSFVDNFKVYESRSAIEGAVLVEALDSGKYFIRNNAGINYEFNSKGLLTKIFNDFEEALIVHRFDNSLYIKEISSTYKWSIKFTYSNNIKKSSSYLRNIPKLKEINITTSDQSTRYAFSYKEHKKKDEYRKKYLKSVKIENDFVFKAEYSDVSSSTDEVSEIIKNRLKKNMQFADMMADNQFPLNNVFIVNKEDHYFYTMVDVNGDGFLDRIKFDLEQLIKKQKEIYSDLEIKRVPKPKGGQILFGGVLELSPTLFYDDKEVLSSNDLNELFSGMTSKAILELGNEKGEFRKVRDYGDSNYFQIINSRFDIQYYQLNGVPKVNGVDDNSSYSVFIPIDVDGDDRYELLVCGNSSGLLSFDNNYDVNFSPFSFECSEDVKVTDFDGDGVLEIYNFNDNVYSLFGDKALLKYSVNSKLDSDEYGILSESLGADYDGDGIPDINFSLTSLKKTTLETYNDARIGSESSILNSDLCMSHGVDIDKRVRCFGIVDTALNKQFDRNLYLSKLETNYGGYYN